MAEDQTRSNFKIISVDTTPGGQDRVFDKGKGQVRLIKFKTDLEGAGNISFGTYVDESDSGSWPYDGCFVKEMSFTTKKNGEYTNYNAKKIIYGKQEERPKEDAKKDPGPKEQMPEESSRPPVGDPVEREAAAVFSKASPLWFCAGYAKDIVLAAESNRIAVKTKPKSAVDLADDAVTLACTMFIDYKSRVKSQILKV